MAVGQHHLHHREVVAVAIPHRIAKKLSVRALEDRAQGASIALDDVAGHGAVFEPGSIAHRPAHGIDRGGEGFGGWTETDRLWMIEALEQVDRSVEGGDVFETHDLGLLAGAVVRADQDGGGALEDVTADECGRLCWLVERPGGGVHEGRAWLGRLGMVWRRAGATTEVEVQGSGLDGRPRIQAIRGSSAA